MTYFKNYSDINELKNLYRNWAFKLHPDKNGKKEDFQVMSNEYTKKLKNALNGKFAAERVEIEIEIDKEMRLIINKLIHLESVIIEIIGNWLWITGNTYPFKDILKKTGLKFSRKKTAWFWHTGNFKKSSSKFISLTEIRYFYGTQKIESEPKHSLT